VETPGWFDLRSVAVKPFPADMSGMRCLDVGTFEGFWALHMHRRGAREVLGVDILDPRAWDWPVGSDEEVVRALEERKRGGLGFETVRAALDHPIERRELSVYDLDEERIGRFDLSADRPRLVFLPPGAAHPRPSLRPRAALRALRTGEGREVLFASRSERRTRRCFYGPADDDRARALRIPWKPCGSPSPPTSAPGWPTRSPVSCARGATR